MTPLLYLISFLLLCFGVSVISMPLDNKLLLGSIALLLMQPVHKLKLSPVRLLFLILCGWVVLCTFTSPTPQLSFLGHHARREGLITLAVLACFAIRYWQVWSESFALACILLLVMLVALVIRPFVDDIQYQCFVMPKVALGAFGAVAGTFLFSLSPWTLLLTTPVIIASNCRTAMVALVVGVIVQVGMMRIKPVK